MIIIITAIEKGCMRDNVYSVDKNGSNWHFLPWKSLASVSSFKISKERVTSNGACKCQWEHSLNLLVIDTSENLQYLKNVQSRPRSYKLQKSS